MPIGAKTLFWETIPARAGRAFPDGGFGTKAVASIAAAFFLLKIGGAGFGLHILVCSCCSPDFIEWPGCDGSLGVPLIND